ncbi:MAG: C40 family peptidase, partial [Bacteroidales bacterium]|nr:C40 family peptidase [Bacteroidales bacterium]
LPRNTSQQVRAGVPVEFDSLQPGDLLFFGTPATDDKLERINHVGIYIGGNRFIHASQLVRISSLDPSEPDYYERKPLRARRILGHTDSNGITSLSKSPWYFIQSGNL